MSMKLIFWDAVHEYEDTLKVPGVKKCQESLLKTKDAIPYCDILRSLLYYHLKCSKFEQSD